MGIADDILRPDAWEAALAALQWQTELGAVDAIGDAPVNSYALPDSLRAAPSGDPATGARGGAATPAVTGGLPAAGVPAADPVEVAERAAAAAPSIDALHDQIASFELCELKRGARNLVFADGRPGARVMIVGEAPGREEDLEGRPFVGRAGQLLDRMFAAIGLSRTSPDTEDALYITNVMPWRPPQNREPTPAEIAMMRPFLMRHIALADPEVVVVMGNTPCLALLNRKGILSLRGQWTDLQGRPVLPMTHPAYLLRTPAAKREAWADLLSLKAKLGR